MKKILLFLTVLFSIACSRDKDDSQYPATYPPQIVFDPSIEIFEGVPGDVFNLKVKIVGKDENTTFNLLKMERLVHQSITTDTLLFSEQGMLTPYSYEFQTILKEEDIGNDFQLKFTVSRDVRLSSVTTVNDIDVDKITVRVNSKE